MSSCQYSVDRPGLSTSCWYDLNRFRSLHPRLFVVIGFFWIFLDGLGDTFGGIFERVGSDRGPRGVIDGDPSFEFVDGGGWAEIDGIGMMTGTDRGFSLFFRSFSCWYSDGKYLLKNEVIGSSFCSVDCLCGLVGFDWATTFCVIDTPPSLLNCSQSDADGFGAELSIAVRSDPARLSCSRERSATWQTSPKLIFI